MRLRAWLEPPRHLLALFAAVTMVSTAALAWSSWQLVSQDRDLERQRAQELRDRAATTAVGTLQGATERIEAQLRDVAAGPGDAVAARAEHAAATWPRDAVLLSFRDAAVAAYPAGRLLYYPVLPASTTVTSAELVHADAAEFRSHDFEKAIALAQSAAASAAPALRAQALLRIARNQRKLGRASAALDTYTRLAALKETAIDGVPAELIARAAMCDLLAETGPRETFAVHAGALAVDLGRGRWQLLRATYDYYAGEVRRWTGDEAQGDASRGTAALLSEAARAIWRDRAERRPTAGRRVLWVGTAPMVVIERSSGDVDVAAVAGASLIASALGGAEAPDANGVSVTTTDTEGRLVWGPQVPERNYAVRLGSRTGLPWTVYASSPDETPGGLLTARSKLVLAGLSAIVLLVSGGSYLIGRAVVRELRVARLQSDFVSSVSHEFRTPLTAIRQMSELLASGRVPDDGIRQECYEALQYESSRLHRLVEGLLRFGRLQAEAMPLELSMVDAAAFVGHLACGFGADAARQGFTLELDTPGAAGTVSIDREALGCAIWNLVDNAMKYSPTCRTVWLSIEPDGDRVAIRVRDRGVGIPDAERSHVFDKFVRGQEAATLGVPGTGIGLAVARQIVLRHGGDLTLDSTPGSGSTFTVLIPRAT